MARRCRRTYSGLDEALFRTIIRRCSLSGILPNSIRSRLKHFQPNVLVPLLIWRMPYRYGYVGRKVGTYDEFRRLVLLRVIKDGYNAIQIMAIQEHPYYGSFRLSCEQFLRSLFAFRNAWRVEAADRKTHQNGMPVIMDIVHSHAVWRNEVGRSGRIDGSSDLISIPGERREHPAWDSLCFDYGKNSVMHFCSPTASSARRISLRRIPFRRRHLHALLQYGLGEAFCNYDDYYNGHRDGDAICYRLWPTNWYESQSGCHYHYRGERNAGTGCRIVDGGYGFDYRMAMNIPDFWIKTIKGEGWRLASFIDLVGNDQSSCRWTISYAESHDQALVGDKTGIFRLIDTDMYWHDGLTTTIWLWNAVLRFIRWFASSRQTTINGGLSELHGQWVRHPEWIDFPREGNGWSYKYARRQWQLVDDMNLKYHFLGDFDRAMIELIGKGEGFPETACSEGLGTTTAIRFSPICVSDACIVFNFNPSKSFTRLWIPRPERYGNWFSRHRWSSLRRFWTFLMTKVEHPTVPDPLYVKEKKEWSKFYVPASLLHLYCVKAFRAKVSDKKE